MAPRVTRGPLPTWGGRRRNGAPRCRSGGSPSRAAAVAGAAAAAAAAAVAPSSSWKRHREPSSQLAVGHAWSAVVAKVAVDHSSTSSSSGYPRDEVSTSSLQPPCMSSPSGKQPGLATCVDDAYGADAVVGASSGNPSVALQTSLPEEDEPLSPALQKEVAIEILFRFDLARKKRILSTDELDLYDDLKSLLPRLEAEIGEVNADGADAVEEEEEPLSPALQMEAALKVMFRLDLAREMRILSADELDLYDDMKSLLPRLEAEIGEDNADEADVVVEMEEEKEEEPLSPALKMEVAIEVLFRLDLQRKKRILSADELDLIIHIKSLLPRLEVKIGEVEKEEEEEEEELLSPALKMDAALKVMFRLDLAREMRILSADELHLYDDMKSLLLPRLEAEIGEAATAPSIALEDPPTCQLHAPSVALAGANEVPSPMVPGASTSIKLYTGLQLPERSIVVTNAELSTPGPEATPSSLKSSAEPEPAIVDYEITEALYGHNVCRRRLPIFRDICPE